LADEFEQAFLGGLVQFAGASAAMRFRVNRSGLSLALAQTHNHRYINHEQGSELLKGMSAPLHSRHNAFTQIVGKSSHDDTSANACNLLKALYSLWHAKGNRSNRVIDVDTTTIEHIYAQSPGHSVASLDALVNDLGNLTLLSQGDNDRVANKEFAGKMPVYENSSFLMNKRLAEQGTWTARELAARRKRLIDLALKVFRV